MVAAAAGTGGLLKQIILTGCSTSKGLVSDLVTGPVSPYVVLAGLEKKISLHGGAMTHGTGLHPVWLAWATAVPLQVQELLQHRTGANALAQQSDAGRNAVEVMGLQKVYPGKRSRSACTTVPSLTLTCMAQSRLLDRKLFKTGLC